MLEASDIKSVNDEPMNSKFSWFLVNWFVACLMFLCVNGKAQAAVTELPPFTTPEKKSAKASNGTRGVQPKTSGKIANKQSGSGDGKVSASDLALIKKSVLWRSVQRPRRLSCVRTKTIGESEELVGAVIRRRLHIRSGTDKKGLLWRSI